MSRDAQSSCCIRHPVPLPTRGQSGFGIVWGQRYYDRSFERLIRICLDESELPFWRWQNLSTRPLPNIPAAMLLTVEGPYLFQ